MAEPSNIPLRDSSNPLVMLGGVALDLLLVCLKTLGLMVVVVIALVLLALPVVALGPIVAIGYLVLIPLGGVFRHSVMRRYLRRKLTPLFAATAVSLCTAMVIIVISVMGGFADMMTEAVRKLSGDITIAGDQIRGFPHYQELADRIEKELPDDAVVATPYIRTWGLLRFDRSTRAVQVLGIKSDGYMKATNFEDTLMWSTEDLVERFRTEYADIEGRDDEGRKAVEQVVERIRQIKLKEHARTFEVPELYRSPEDAEAVGIIMGIEVAPGTRRTETGSYPPETSLVGAQFTLSVVPVTGKGGLLEPVARRVTVINEVKSGLLETDARLVYVHFDLLQKLLKMDPYYPVDMETGEQSDTQEPGRAHEILIKIDPKLTVDQVEPKVQRIVDTFMQERGVPLGVGTWKTGPGGQFLNAVDREKKLLVILFAIISMVAVVMIGVIFYMITLEKTRDIGILRAIGASRKSIASIYIGYSLVIGIIGTAIGTTLGVMFVWRINDVQNLIDRVVRFVTMDAYGFKMWDPKFYFFDQIPNRVNWTEVAIIVVVAIGASVMGAVMPALRASHQDPVESLRYE